MQIPIKILSDKAVLPGTAYDGDAGFDLSSTQEVVLAPFERVLIPTGLAIALPEGYAGLVMPRSGLSSKHGITVVNAPGLIDSNYRGELKVALINLDAEKAFTIEVGMRVAQLVVQKVEQPSFTLVEELPSSERGEGGFGSSGINA